jgi:hypothetical protein
MPTLQADYERNKRNSSQEKKVDLSGLRESPFQDAEEENNESKVVLCKSIYRVLTITKLYIYF